ncbi:hypothetical protein NA78x_000407 [Anatilimnocola sp. NA78]|uniref:hypothetical protein n=1 Tax=Anatilimnocola sp. NA78 TaxID=3415683 RepID=UPI003CE4C9B3
MLQTHETTPWEEVAPGVRQRRHTLRTEGVPMELAIELTGKLNEQECFGALPGHLSMIKLTNREDHAIVIVLERSLHWCFQTDDEGGYRFEPTSREACDYDLLFAKPGACSDLKL